jgi:hypothetical protein
MEGCGMKEAQIQMEIVRFLRTVGCSVYDTSQGYRKERGGTRTSAGIPDLIVIHPSAWTFAELKTPKGKMSTAQTGFRLACEEAGIPWALWRSVHDAWEWAKAAGIVREAS